MSWSTGRRLLRLGAVDAVDRENKIKKTWM